MLPQINRKREFDYDEASGGMRQILWGVFKKVVIADNCALLANRIFNNYDQLESSVLIMGVVYFAFQIYGDFSGYSDIAIGSAKLIGFSLTTNFKTPYFSRDISEFWRRWHISLSTWFRDYLFIPLNLQLRNLKKSAVVISVIITFLTCGLWHGANWTYIAWGGIIGLYFIPSLLRVRSNKNPDTAAKGKLIPSVKEILQIGFTFSLVCFAWIFFKSESIDKAVSFIRRIFSARFLPKDF
jgi:D-alanyl-lipoteichoic acid acyltransferase DltB (MBOAT superfamily)